MTRVLAWLLSLAAAFMAGGCGVDAEDEPHTVELPRSPLTGATSAAVDADESGEVAAVLCLVRDGRLVQTVRRQGAIPTVQQQLDDLAAGPVAAEQSSGLSSALSGLSLVADITPPAAEVTVEIVEADEGSARSDEILAYGQIVCTLTARVDVTSVVFTREGQRLRIPRADGTLSDAPLRAGDYESLMRAA